MYHFTEADYNSSNGMQTSIFGPMIWSTLHIISFNYPVKPTKKQKKEYKNFLLSIGDVLPCLYCRQNFKKNMISAGFCDSVMNNRYTFSHFIYKLHNCVNKMLGKNIKISYSEVRDRYEHFRSRCSEKEKNEYDANKKNNRTSKLEKKCDNPLHGVKSKCVIGIVPQNSKKPNFHIDKKCVLKKN